MADLDALQSALVKADAAGNADDARALAAEIVRVRGAAPTPPEGPVARLRGMMDNLVNPKDGRTFEATPAARQGFMDPLTGGAQLLTHMLPDSVVNAGNKLNNYIADKTGLLDTIPAEGFDAKVRADEKAYQESRGAESGKFDPQRMAGTALNPINYVPASKLPVATSLIGKLFQGATAGGTSGALMPVTEEGDYGRQKAVQTGVGAAVGAAGTAGIEGAKAVASTARKLIEPMTESGRAAILNRFQNDLIGEGGPKQQIIDALENAKTIVPGSKPTAGEALADIPEATGLAAHQKAIAKAPGVSGQFMARDAEQEAARRAAIDTVGKTPADLDSAIAQRAATTTPMRETALANANIAGVKVPQLTERLADRSKSVADALQQKGQLETLAQQQGNRAQYYEAYPTAAVRSPRAPAERFAENAADAKAAAGTATEVLGNRKAERDVTKYMLDSLDAHGLKPLEASTVANNIDALASKPGLRASDVVTKSLGEARDKIASLADKNGVIDANDLYMIRKEIGNTIQKYASENKNFDQRLTSGLQKQVQGYIDDAIEGAGGAGWKGYLAKYADMSKPINEMQVGQYLKDKLVAPLETGERAGPFAQAVRDAPGTIKRSTGGPRFTELGQVLSPQNEQVVNAILEDLQRKAAFGKVAAGTNLSGGTTIAEGAKTGIHLPNLLSRPAMIANFFMKNIGQGADTKINALAAQQYLNPQTLADALKTAPPNQQQQIVNALLQRMAIGAGASTAARQ